MSCEAAPLPDIHADPPVLVHDLLLRQHVRGEARVVVLVHHGVQRPAQNNTTVDDDAEDDDDLTGSLTPLCWW